MARLRSAWTAIRSGSASTPVGGCQLSSSSSGYGWTGRRLRARWVSIAALTQIRFSHDLTLPPRKRREVAEGREEGLLDAVGRLVAIGHHAHDEREQLVLVEQDQVVECIEVAISGSLEQDEVAALDGVVGDRRRAKVLHGRGVPPDGD